MSILSLIKEKRPEDLGNMLISTLDDFVKEKIEEAVNDLMDGEIEDFLTDALRDETLDVRSGYYKRHLKTKFGSIEVKVPRDRLNYFETKIIKPYKQTCEDVEFIVQSLYLKGMSQNEIVDYLDKTIGLSMSRETIGRTVRKILSTALEFKKRRLPKCVVIFMDGAYVPLKRKYARIGGCVTDECVEVVMGVTASGHKEILDFVTVPNEGAHSWKDFLFELKERGVGDPKIFVTDGLQGMPEAIAAAFPNAVHQRCLVHIQRNIAQAVRVKDRTAICGDFREVYTQETEAGTKAKFEEFTKKWGITYPHLIKKVMETQGLFTYLGFPKAMWQSIRTSNAIESFNSDLQRYSNHRILFNSEANQMIVLTSCIADYNNTCKKKKEKYIQELTEEERATLGFDIL